MSSSQFEFDSAGTGAVLPSSIRVLTLFTHFNERDSTPPVALRPVYYIFSRINVPVIVLRFILNCRSPMVNALVDLNLSDSSALMPLRSQGHAYPSSERL